MKIIILMALLIESVDIAGLFIVSNENLEAEIRKMEEQELDALLKGDTVALFTKFWSPKMVVNTPANIAGDIENTKRHLREGKIDYSSMTRNIEMITFNENIAIVMGAEVLSPRGNNIHAGKTVTRRFTNIWMQTAEGWRLVARQSTIISVV